MVEISLSESLWGNCAYRESKCGYGKINATTPTRVIEEKNNGYANISKYLL